MTSKLIASMTLAGAAIMGLGSEVRANGVTPGSLLVFPVFDNVSSNTTLITVTNTSDDTDLNSNNVPVGRVIVEYVYINGANCQETNRTRTLSPNDTLSIITKFDNPNMQEGYLYVFAKRSGDNEPIKFDHLVGAAMDLSSSELDGPNFEYVPVVFRAKLRLTEGQATDIDDDGLRDLNGEEYEQAPAELVFARFLGQDESSGFNSELVLINLTGGAQFQAIVDFLIYNDNEEIFSAQDQFRCWSRKRLLDTSGVFSNDFLKNNTNQNPNEVPQANNFPETGWFKVNGNVASSNHISILNPALLGLRIECRHSNSDDECGAALPFWLGVQNNGDLLPLGIDGDTDDSP